MVAKIPVEEDREYLRVSLNCAACDHEMVVHVGLTLSPNSTPSIKCPACGVEFCPLVHGPIIAGPFEGASPR